jgi:recombination protein RecT
MTTETTAVTRREENAVLSLFEKAKSSFVQVLPRQIPADRMMRIMLSALRSTPALQKCDPMSVMGSLLQCAQLGLEPNSPLGLAYMIPYGKECTLIVGYKGMLKMAYQSPSVKSINAHVVYANDGFSINYGTNEVIEHTPNFEGERGELKGAYCVVQLKDGGVIQRYLPRVEILKARPKYWEKTPWKTNEEEMWIKTAIRRTLKTAPLSPEAFHDVQQAIAVDEAASRGATWQYREGEGMTEALMIEPTQVKSEVVTASPSDLAPKADAKTLKEIRDGIKIISRESEISVGDLEEEFMVKHQVQKLEDLTAVQAKAVIENINSDLRDIESKGGNINGSN